MEKELYKALALVLLESRKDQWGNDVESPLASAITKWAGDNRDDIAAAIIKNLGVDDLALKVADNVTRELIKYSTWSTNSSSDELKKAVMEKVASKLADKELERISNLPK